MDLLPESLTVQDNGKIVVAGNPQGAGFALVRFRANGSVEQTFGREGMASVIFPEGDGIAAAVTPVRGRLLAVGFVGPDWNADTMFAVAQFHGR